MGPNKVRSVKRKINAVKGQIAAAVKSANVIFQDALRKVNQAIETIKVKRKELLGYRTTLQLEVGKGSLVVHGFLWDDREQTFAKQ